ncbi:ATP synthase subunit I [Myxococcota bacterium]|nr:ATP synthase subunit I [Myxococcota bacterium]
MRGPRRIGALIALLTVAGTAVGFAAGRPGLATGLLAGGALSFVNFWLLARIALRVVRGPSGGTGALMVRLGVKYGVLAGCVALFLWVFHLDVPGLLIGLSLVLPAVILHGTVDLFS